MHTNLKFLIQRNFKTVVFVGSGALASSTLLRKLNAGDYVGAQAQFMVWNKATVNGIKIELAGLTRRRKAEAALFGEGV